MGKARILVADDGGVTRMLLMSVLQQEGYTVLGASNGKEALAHLKAQPVDFIITDMMMPEVDGSEVIRYARKNHPGVRIIAITAGGDNCIDSARREGATWVFSKPLDAGELIKTIESCTLPAC